MAKPVKVTIARMMIAAGAIACESVRDTEAIVLNNMDMTSVEMKLTKTKKKNGPGSRRRLAIK
jgi:hypothetical protein